MRQMIAVTLLGLAIATPVFAQTADNYARTPLSSDGEVRAVESWDRVVARANAYRLQEQATERLARQDAAHSDSRPQPVTGDAATGAPIAQIR